MNARAVPPDEDCERANPFMYTTWAIAQRVGNPRAKHVLVTLSYRCMGKGYCWPSRATIANDTEWSVDTVDRILKYLEAAGFIAIERRRRGNESFTSSKITLLVDADKMVDQLVANRTGKPEAGFAKGADREAETEVEATPADGGVAAGCGYPLAADCGHPSRSPAATLAATGGSPERTLETTGEALSASEREAIEKEKADRIEAEFKEFVVAYGLAPGEPVSAAREEFERLNVKDRQLAIREAPAFRELRKASPGRKLWMAPENWLRKREFEHASQVAKTQAQAQGLENRPVFVRETFMADGERRETRAWIAWCEEYQRLGKPRPIADWSALKRARGWWFPTLFPPGGHADLLGDTGPPERDAAE